MNITELIEVFNGSVLVEAGHQEWGYIPETWHLGIPGEIEADPNDDQGVKDAKSFWDRPHIGYSFFSDINPGIGICNRTRFLKSNYHLLTKANLPPQQALLIACMRMAIADSGAIALNPHQRNVLVDEYTFVNPPRNDWDAVVIPPIDNHRAIASWAKKFTGILVSHIIFLFCARGHHYMPEYNEIYQKLYRNSFINDPIGFSLPTPETTYRLSIHCFGVAPLLGMVLDLKRDNKMAAAMMIRFSPHPPIAGVAQFTTMKATFDDMKRHSLWDRIRDFKSNELNELYEVCDDIRAHPYRHHVASKVITGKARIIPDARFYTSFSSLAPIALGYIDYLGRRHSLSGQRAITQKYGGIDPAVEMWSRAFDEYGPPSAKDYLVNDFFAMVTADRSVQDAAREAAMVVREIETENIKLEHKKKKLEVQELEVKLTERLAALPMGARPPRI